MIHLFEELGFERRHTKEKKGELDVTGIRMKDANGNYLYISQSNQVPGHDLVAIGIGVGTAIGAATGNSPFSRKSSIYADFRVSLCLKKVFPQGQKVFPHPEKGKKWGFYPQMACDTVAAASGSGVFSTYS